MLGCAFDKNEDGDAWVVLPDDVISIDVASISKHFQNAGWRVSSASSEQHTLAGDVDLVLDRVSGKLLIKCTDWKTAHRIADFYIERINDA